MPLMWRITPVFEDLLLKRQQKNWVFCDGNHPLGFLLFINSYSLRPLLAPFPPPTPTSTAPLPLPLNTRWLFLLLCSHWLKWMLAIFIGIYWQSKNILSKLSNRWGFVNCCRCVFIAIARTVPQKLSQAVLEEGDFDVQSLKGNKRWKV